MTQNAQKIDEGSSSKTCVGSTFFWEWDIRKNIIRVVSRLKMVEKEKKISCVINFSSKQWDSLYSV